MPAAHAASSNAGKTDRTLSVRLPAAEAEALAELAWQRRSAMSSLARDALREKYPSIVADDENRAATP